MNPNVMGGSMMGNPGGGPMNQMAGMSNGQMMGGMNNPQQQQQQMPVNSMNQMGGGGGGMMNAGGGPGVMVGMPNQCISMGNQQQMNAMQQQQQPNQGLLPQQQQQQQQPNPMVNAGPGNPGMNPMMNQMSMNMPRMNVPGNVFPRNVAPNQFLRQSPSPSVASPAGGGVQAQMIPSPAMAQTPSPQMPGNNMMNVVAGPNRQNMQNVMAPSPGSSLNTPAQPSNIPSPFNPQEDQLYREKYRQLTKYIEPLKRMTARMDSENNSK